MHVSFISVKKRHRFAFFFLLKNISYFEFVLENGFAVFFFIINKWNFRHVHNFGIPIIWRISFDKWFDDNFWSPWRKILIRTHFNTNIFLFEVQIISGPWKWSFYFQVCHFLIYKSQFHFLRKFVMTLSNWISRLWLLFCCVFISNFLFRSTQNHIGIVRLIWTWLYHCFEKKKHTNPFRDIIRGQNSRQ